MINAKEFYRSYIADDTVAELNGRLAHLIKALNPNHVFEFGMGSGKNLKLLPGIDAGGMDISFVNVAKAHLKNDLPFVMVGDENYLRHLCNYDVVFTVSVLDHIENVDVIIGEFKRIANVAIYLAETNDIPGQYYFPHDYESYGFEKMSYKWTSSRDGALYQIWEWKRANKVEPVLVGPKHSIHFKESGNSFIE